MTVIIGADTPPKPRKDIGGFEAIEARIDAIASNHGSAAEAARELIMIGEDILERWIKARGEDPVDQEREGFRLIALYRQGARGEPSFNACRETVRELAYHYNLITLDPSHPDTEKRLHLAVMVAKHLCLFVSGKMQVAGLGEFCCSSRPLRSDGQ
jgi:hypothetical protein